MILPKLVKTRHKVRDFKIVQLYSQGQKLEEIAKRFNVTSQNVSYIVRKNMELLEIDRNFEKQKRINRLNRIFAVTPDTLSRRKDILDVISEMRKEIEGEKGVNVDARVLVNVSMPPQSDAESDDTLNAQIPSKASN